MPMCSYSKCEVLFECTAEIHVCVSFMAGAIIGIGIGIFERKMVDIKEIKDQLMNKQNDMWKQAVPKKPKLRTYCLFKETMDIENYIKYNLSSSERSAMAQFRFGILPLNIGTGRFRNQALDERLCTLCEFNEIEDESHFLFQCSLYDE